MVGWLFVFLWHINPCREIEYVECILYRGVRPSQEKGCPEYDIKLHPVLKLWGVWNTLSLPLLPGPLYPEVVIPVKVPFIGQVDLFVNYLYLIGIPDIICA